MSFEIKSLASGFLIISMVVSLLNFIQAFPVLIAALGDDNSLLETLHLKPPFKDKMYNIVCAILAIILHPAYLYVSLNVMNDLKTDTKEKRLWYIIVSILTILPLLLYLTLPVPLYLILWLFHYAAIRSVLEAYNAME